MFCEKNTFIHLISIYFLGKAQNNDSILLELDKTIEQSNIYESKTRRSISNLLELLNHSSSLEKICL
jgi:hypothetical protein